jgi:predicted short-subunit dehydrogenase-like oxidoreductase (DUF2520 family)
MKPSVAFFGAGRLGKALAQRFYQLGYPIAGIASRTRDSASWLAERVGSQVVEGFPDADLIFLTVPDDVIREVAQKLAAHSPTGAVIHTSGVHSLEVLAALVDHPVGSFHPLYPFQHETTLTGNEHMLIALEASNEKLGQQLWDLARDLGGHPATIRLGYKMQYHAAAVMASNYLVTLFSIALMLMAEAGVPIEEARIALAQLMRGNLDNLEKLDPSEALTGPIARGDLVTVQSHVTALGSSHHDYANAYRLLGHLTTDLAPRLDEETRHQLHLIFRDS